MLDSHRPDFTYLLQPPRKYTFEQPRLKEWTESFCTGKVLNLFAGKVRLNCHEFRVDISDEFHPDYMGDAYEFVKTTERKFDTIILDPPYNLRKAREKYNGKYIGSFTKIKNSIPRLLEPGGLVITFGYDSVGMSRKRGFKKIAICLVCHNGDHNDTIVVVERYMGETLRMNLKQIDSGQVTEMPFKSPFDNPEKNMGGIKL